MIFIKSMVIKPHPVQPMSDPHLFVGVVYDDENRKFISFRAELSPVEVGMLYKGDILVGEIVENCFLNKPNHSISNTPLDEIDSIISDSLYKEQLKPYLRDNTLTDLGL
jgi:hypothetical protein